MHGRHPCPTNMGMDETYKVNPDREGQELTGIYVRAQNADGRWVSADFLTLDRDSLIAFARSCGAVSDWAMSLVLHLAGYPMFEGALEPARQQLPSHK